MNTRTPTASRPMSGPSGGQHGNIMVVGDDSQSIYSFRGANFANILSFPERYPARKSTSWRSITDPRRRFYIWPIPASSSTATSSPRSCRLSARQGPGLSLVPAQDILEQASFVAQKVEEIRDGGTPLSQMAVLYRAHYHSMELQMELTRRGIPFRCGQACVSSNRPTSKTCAPT